MYRKNKTATTSQAIADMSQFSVEAGRKSIEQQYSDLREKRQPLVERLRYLESKLAELKARCNVHKNMSFSDQKYRKDIIEEIAQIRNELATTKPKMRELDELLHPSEHQILKDILSVLINIKDSLANPRKE